MSGKPQFSIIVPCCEVAPYVAECVASLKIQQGSFEAIFVVEDSRDQTESVLRQAIGDDARFQVITEPRSGSPATPRNTGLSVATGDYVIFLDGDDTLAPTALVDLADWISRFPETDLFPCAVREGDLLHDNYPATCREVSLTSAAATLAVATYSVEPMAMAQMTVCRRAFLEAHHLRFADGLRHEDEEFTPRALYFAERVVPTHLPFYLYRRRADSITTEKKERNLADLAVVYRNLFRFHAQRHPSPEVSRAWARNWTNTFYATFFFKGKGTVLVPEHRRAALATLFAEGFSDFRSLAQFASRPKRVAAAVIQWSCRLGCPGLADLFFQTIYYPLSLRRTNH